MPRQITREHQPARPTRPRAVAHTFGWNIELSITPRTVRVQGNVRRGDGLCEQGKRAVSRRLL